MKGTISIQYNPYPEEIDKNKVMEAGKFLFPNFKREYPVVCIERGGKDVYLTGLNPSKYPEDQRNEIVQAKEELEKHFGEGILEENNHNFWKDKKLEIERKTTFLNMTNPEDRLTYYIIKGGGYPTVASNYDDCVGGATPKRWYLIDSAEYAELGAEDDRKINRAISMLQTMEESKGYEDMLMVHKMLISLDRGITRSSPKAMLYKDLSDFIHGRTVRTAKRQTPGQFIDAAELLKKDRKKASITAIVKEANYQHFLGTTEDNQLKNLQTGTKYGSTLEKAIAYLYNPANQSELDNLRERVEEKWAL